MRRPCADLQQGCQSPNKVVRHTGAAQCHQLTGWRACGGSDQHGRDRHEHAAAGDHRRLFSSDCPYPRSSAHARQVVYKERLLRDQQQVCFWAAYVPVHGVHKGHLMWPSINRQCTHDWSCTPSEVPGGTARHDCHRGQPHRRHCTGTGLVLPLSVVRSGHITTLASQPSPRLRQSITITSTLVLQHSRLDWCWFISTSNWVALCLQDRRPALGDHWLPQPHTRVHIQRQQVQFLSVYILHGSCLPCIPSTI